MKKGTGILLDADFDLRVDVKRNNSGLIERGLVIGATTSQNQMILLMANKGELKEHPMSGVGVDNFVEDYSGDALAREIRKEFSQDGMTVRKIKVNIPNIEIDADYL